MTAEGSCRVVSNDGEVYEKPWSAPHLVPLFTELTADETAPVWARRAVRFIHRHTRERGQPPTFREVFAELAVPRLDSPRGRVGVGGVERAEEFFQRDP